MPMTSNSSVLFVNVSKAFDKLLQGCFSSRLDMATAPFAPLSGYCCQHGLAVFEGQELYTKSEEADIASMADSNQGKINLMFKSNGRRSKILSLIKARPSQSLQSSPPQIISLTQAHQDSDVDLSQARSAAAFSTMISSSKPGDALTAAQARKLFTESETKPDHYNCIFGPTSRKQGKGYGTTNLKESLLQDEDGRLYGASIKRRV